MTNNDTTRKRSRYVGRKKKKLGKCITRLNAFPASANASVDSANRSSLRLVHDQDGLRTVQRFVGCPLVSPFVFDCKGNTPQCCRHSLQGASDSIALVGLPCSSSSLLPCDIHGLIASSLLGFCLRCRFFHSWRCHLRQLQFPPRFFLLCFRSGPCFFHTGVWVTSSCPFSRARNQACIGRVPHTLGFRSSWQPTCT